MAVLRLSVSLAVVVATIVTLILQSQNERLDPVKRAIREVVAIFGNFGRSGPKPTRDLFVQTLSVSFMNTTIGPHCSKRLHRNQNAVASTVGLLGLANFNYVRPEVKQAHSTTALTQIAFF
jgi:hypothetical protein